MRDDALDFLVSDHHTLRADRVTHFRIEEKHVSATEQGFGAGVSKMTRLSIPEATAKARRAGKLALIKPVTTSVDGRWVATTR